MKAPPAAQIHAETRFGRIPTSAMAASAINNVGMMLCLVEGRTACDDFPLSARRLIGVV
jgi:hypothetical protein